MNAWERPDCNILAKSTGNVDPPKGSMGQRRPPEHELVAHMVNTIAYRKPILIPISHNVRRLRFFRFGSSIARGQRGGDCLENLF